MLSSEAGKELRYMLFQTTLPELPQAGPTCRGELAWNSSNFRTGMGVPATLRGGRRSRLLCLSKKQLHKPPSRGASLTVPELEQSKTTVINSLASAHSRRSYKHAIEKFVAWYRSEPRLGFNRSVMVRYRSFLEGLWLSAASWHGNRCSFRETYSDGDWPR
jgi:hypothetical protein